MASKPKTKPKGRRQSRAQAQPEIRVVTPEGEPAEMPEGAQVHAKPGDEIVVVDAEDYIIKSPGRSKVRHMSGRKMLAEEEAVIRKYEIRYEMSSEKMAQLLSLDAINPTAEILMWYSAYSAVRKLRAATPTDG